MRQPLWMSFVIFIFVLSPSWAQDPVQLDPKHYKVEIDNDQVRVLRTHLGPRESSPMHEHPASVVVPQTTTHLRFTLADCKTEERTFSAGSVRFRPPIKHAAENLDNTDVEVIEIELKTAPPKPADLKKKKKSNCRLASVFAKTGGVLGMTIH